jgi:hypothetical protein
MKLHKAENVQRYRAAIPLTGGSVGALVMLGLGVGMVVDGFHSGIGESVIGGLVIVFACVLAGHVFTSYAELTPGGLAYRFNFRRRIIPWASIESFRAARGPGTGPWPGLVVERRWDRPLLVGSIVGTRRYVDRVIAEIEAYRTHVAPTAADER